MPPLFPPEIIENSIECYHARISKRSRAVYSLLLLLLLAALVALPLVKIDITTQSRGVVRSPFENSAIQTAVSGEIVHYAMAENKTVRQGDTLLLLNTERLEVQIELATQKMAENELFMQDLSALLQNKPTFVTPKYRSEHARYVAKASELTLTANYLKKELSTEKELYDKQVSSGYEYELAQNRYQNADKQLHSTIQEYRATWAAEKTALELQNTELQSTIAQIGKEKQLYVIKAPISGTLVQVAGFQTGNYISATQPLAYISSAESLLAECYVSPSDIGYVRLHQPVMFQMDAFNYNDWGMITGEVIELLNDVVMVSENTPMFRVRCSLHKESLELKNGYVGTVQKGMGFTARFTLNRRTLWQLLFDKVDNWLNPKIIE